MQDNATAKDLLMTCGTISPPSTKFTQQTKKYTDVAAGEELLVNYGSTYHALHFSQ